MGFLEDFYSHYDEEGRLLSRHGQVEYLPTMKYIAVMPNSSILYVPLAIFSTLDLFISIVLKKDEFRFLSVRRSRTPFLLI